MAETPWQRNQREKLEGLKSKQQAAGIGKDTKKKAKKKTTGD